MRTSEFKGVKTILNKYISQSASITELCVVDNEINLDHLTIGQVKELTEKARDLQSKTDMFLKDELYHIIGMGNLSASQVATLNKLVKEITAHRSVVKLVASVPTLPTKITTTSKYKSKTFGFALNSNKITSV